MDRNIIDEASGVDDKVALLAEGVDRNSFGAKHSLAQRVALLAEGVDRNLLRWWRVVGLTLSPSSRRAWIEILRLSPTAPAAWVALLAEGVDRNYDTICDLGDRLGRPPRGGRG